MKNNVGQLSDLAAAFDFAVNEQCHEYAECDGYQIFTSSSKPVFNVEYAAPYQNDPTARATLCADANKLSRQAMPACWRRYIGCVMRFRFR